VRVNLGLMIAAYLPAGILIAVWEVALVWGLVIGLVTGWFSYSYRRKRQSNE
jgi:uncharacterized membrane protein YbjE (DUF340 family)